MKSSAGVESGWRCFFLSFMGFFLGPGRAHFFEVKPLSWFPIQVSDAAVPGFEKLVCPGLVLMSLDARFSRRVSRSKSR